MSFKSKGTLIGFQCLSHEPARPRPLANEKADGVPSAMASGGVRALGGNLAMWKLAGR